MSSNALEDQSKIFRCENQNSYQKAVNAAALDLCKKDGSLLVKRGKLFELARRKVNDDGYDYAKNESRSKNFGTQAGKTRAKRKYNGEDIRTSRIDDIKESIQSASETINLLTQQKQQYVSTERFLQAAELNSTILQKNKEKRNLESELAKLLKAEKKSKAYRSKKKYKDDQSGSSTASAKGNESGDTDIIPSDSESDVDSHEHPPLPPLAREFSIHGDSGDFPQVPQ